MGNNEQIKGEGQAQELTDTERILGSAANNFNKAQAEQEKSIAINNAKESEKESINMSEIIDLLDQEEKYRREAEEYETVEGSGLFDNDEFASEFINGSPFSRNALEDIREEIRKRIDEYSPEWYEAKEIIEDTYEVRDAIGNTKTNLPSYFRNTCEQRLANGAGSIYEGINSTREMEKALGAAHWKKAEHPDVIPGCQAYVTKDIKGGHFGLLKIADLPDDAAITASDPKGTGKVSMTVSGEKGPEVEDTWLIVGKEDGVDVVFTFHPGEPVRPSVVEVKDCPDGTKLTKEQALNLGFDLAKIV